MTTRTWKIQVTMSNHPGEWPYSVTAACTQTGRGLKAVMELPTIPELAEHGKSLKTVMRRIADRITEIEDELS